MTLTLKDPEAPPIATLLRGVPPTLEPAGSVLTSIEPGRAVVWLRGDIDLALTEDLSQLEAHVGALGPHIVLEVSQMTFCDTTLLNFIAALSKEVAVTVRRPPALLMDLIRICGLAGCVQMANFPGPAPALPA
jgi:hypothetical protein